MAFRRSGVRIPSAPPAKTWLSPGLSDFQNHPAGRRETVWSAARLQPLSDERNDFFASPPMWDSGAGAFPFDLPRRRAADFRNPQTRIRRAVLKTRAVQTLRDYRTPPNRAKRLDCGAFTAAFGRGNDFFASPPMWDSGAG